MLCIEGHEYTRRHRVFCIPGSQPDKPDPKLFSPRGTILSKGHQLSVVQIQKLFPSMRLVCSPISFPPAEVLLCAPSARGIFLFFPCSKSGNFFSCFLGGPAASSGTVFPPASRKHVPSRRSFFSRSLAVLLFVSTPVGHENHNLFLVPIASYSVLLPAPPQKIFCGLALSSPRSRFLLFHVPAFQQCSRLGKGLSFPFFLLSNQPLIFPRIYFPHFPSEALSRPSPSRNRWLPFRRGLLSFKARAFPSFQGGSILWPPPRNTTRIAGTIFLLHCS